VDQASALIQIVGEAADTDAHLAAGKPDPGVVRIVVGGSLVSRHGEVRTFALRGELDRILSLVSVHDVAKLLQRGARPK
jgi:hypothetical protein